MTRKKVEQVASPTAIVGIVDIAVYLPEQVESSKQIAEKTGIPRQVLEERFGIREKRVAGSEEHASDLAGNAAKKILQKIDPGEIDAAIYCGSPYKDYPVWACAPKIQHELGLNKAYVFEIMNMSAGFNTALKIAKDMLLADPHLRNILLVAGSKESNLVDPVNPRTRFMLDFGDGGAAMLIRKGHEENVILESFLHTDGSLYQHVKVPGWGFVLPCTETLNREKHFLDVFNFNTMKNKLNDVSANNFVRVIKEALARSGYPGVSPDFLALLHLKPSINKYILSKLGLKEEQSVYLDQFGHISCVDIVTALHEGLKLQRVREGDLVVMASAGTGYTWGANVIKWGKL